jgi:hypothetical protein
MNTKKIFGSVALTLGLLASQVGAAQAPAGAPAGSTAVCNDGTYFNGATKSGACRGHKGVKTWYGAAKPAAPAAKPAPAGAAKPASTPAPAVAAKPASTPAPAAAPAAKTSTKTTTQAPGGGPGLVWLNTSSNVYHCPGTQYYGKTKAGSYMSESDAKAKGAHSEGGKPCK